MDAHIHTFIHSFTIHVKSLPPTPPPPLRREGETASEEEQKEEERSLWANAHLPSDLHTELINKKTGFDRFLTSLKNMF